MRKYWQTITISLMVFLIGSGVVLASVAEPAAQDNAALSTANVENNLAGRVNETTTATYTTIITVNTTVDTSYDLKHTCGFTSGGLLFPPGDGKCSLRRALVEASHRPQSDRPILIKFNIPLTDTNYNAVTGTWTIMMEADYSSSAGSEAIVQSTLDNPKNPNSYITIDGNTQPGGRSNGYPKIIINGTNSFDLVKVSHNTIRNLAFNGGGGVFLNDVSGVGGSNLVENVWVGLNADGTEIVPGSNPNISLAGGGIDIQGDGNTISGTTVTGSNIGIRIQGDSNIIKYNQIGTRADGTVPGSRLFCDTPSSIYDPAQWYGGWGVQFLSGSLNQVLSNTIAGIHTPHSATETFPPAIWTGGNTNLFRYNTIGVDSSSAEVGVCGQGIYVQGHNIQIWNNTIVNSRSSFFDAQTDDPTEGAIFINDSSPLARKVTVRENIVRDSTSKVIKFGPAIPEVLRLFDPPRITNISDTLVTGQTESGNDCPNCLLELYLDDLTDGEDALELLTTAVVDAAGNFVATLNNPLPANHGIRLTATTQDFGVIGDYQAGTTTKMSPAYGPDGVFTRDLGPGWNLFSFDVTPSSTAVADVLSGLSGQYDLVLGYDSTPGEGAKTYDPANPGASDLTDLDPTHGYWIHITAAATQTLTLDEDPALNDTAITLNEGWNLVSYLPDHTMVVSEALASIAGAYELVQGYEGVGKTYMPGQPGFSDLTEMKPGYGYWIKIKEGVGQQTLTYQPYVVRKPAGAEANSALNSRQGAAVADFFSATTEWADFYGVALLGGQSAPRNATILAYDADGTVAGAFIVHTLGQYGFLHVYADDTRTAGDEGVAAAGEAVSFTINGRPAKKLNNSGQPVDDPIPWNGRGDLTLVNLSAAIPYTPTNEWSDFWGTLTIGGQPAPVGTLLAVYDDDGLYIGDFKLTAAGQYGFLHAYGDDGTTTGDEGANMGDALSFKAWLPGSGTSVNVMPASGSATWQGKGSRSEFNLQEQTSSGGGSHKVYLPVIIK